MPLLPREEYLSEPAALLFHKTDRHGYARLPEYRHAFARYEGIGVKGSRDDTPHTLTGEHLGTRGGSPFVCTRLEGHIERTLGNERTVFRLDAPKAIHFGVSLSRLLVVALAYHPVATHKDGTHTGVWGDACGLGP